MMSSDKETRRPSSFLTYKHKLELIEQIEGGKTLSELARESGISKSSLHYIFKYRAHCDENEFMCENRQVGFSIVLLIVEHGKNS